MALKDFINPIMSGVSVVGNVVSSALTNKARKKEAELQNKWNLEQWNRQNEYDSPSAQMQRLTDAGLNPNLIYGSMSSGTPSAPATSASGSIETPMLDMSPFLYASQIELAKSQAQKNYADVDNETRLTDAKIREIFGDTPLGHANIEYIKSMVAQNSQKVLNLQQDIRESEQRILNLKEDEQAKILENAFNKESFETRVNLLKSELKISQTNAENLQRIIDASVAETLMRTLSSREQANLFHNQARNVFYEGLFDKVTAGLRINKLGADAKLQDALIGLYTAQESKTKADTELVILQYALQDMFGADSYKSDMVSKVVDIFSNIFKMISGKK